jgi:MFS family permease
MKPIRGRIGNIFRAFSHRNYRLFFTGQGLSLIGTWIQTIALNWYLYRVSGSPLVLGIAAFMTQVPFIFLSPYAGVIADRFNRRKILFVTQGVSMAQGLALAALVFSGYEKVTLVIALNVVLGIANAFDSSVRQSFISELTEDRAMLPNMIALNSAMFNAARLVGPTIGAALIAFAGESGCFLLNGISYIAVLGALILIRPVAPVRSAYQRHGFVHEFRQGIRYAYENEVIRNLLFLVAVMSALGFSYVTLMPVIARTVLHGGSHTLGFLMSAGGCGALVGALYLASRKNVRGLLRISAIMSVVVSASLAGLAFSGTVVLSCALIVPVGFGLIIITGSCNTILQTIVDERMRGRIVSLYAMAFMGMAPFGSLFMGWAAENIGVTWAIFAGSVVCLCGGLFFASRLPRMRKAIRPVYVRLGIIPAAQGDASG